MQQRWSIVGFGLVLMVLMVQAESRTRALTLPQVAAPAAPSADEKREPDVIFVPTPPEVVEAMLKTANVTKDDVVYDLGCGDGRIPVAAARDFGARRAVGIDIDPQRIKEANENVKAADVGDRVEIRQDDLFTTDISEATVVTLYLLPTLNVKLMPKLKSELKPGTRIVSHSFDMQGQWEPEKEVDVDGRKVYFWTVPEK
ncbi:MAG: 50S ribosomal protein L11 methyltransferase [Vicinamibacteraceae bacterium]